MIVTLYTTDASNNRGVYNIGVFAAVSTPSLAVAILVILAVVGWFAVGTQVNIRKGDKVLGWLRQALRTIGEKSTLRWLGSAVVELKIQDAKAPFHRAEVLAVFEPRDVAVLWWYHHLRGRRDLLIFRAQLRQPPGFELEALEPDGWSTRGVEQHVRFRNWDPVTVGEHLPAGDSHANAPRLRVYKAGNVPHVQELIAGLLTTISAPNCPVLRLAIRRSDPNLEVHWRLPDAQKIPAQDLFERLQRLGKLME
jgi:hypothetical protein